MRASAHSIRRWLTRALVILAVSSSVATIFGQGTDGLGVIRFDNVGAPPEKRVWIGAVGTENGGILATGNTYRVALYWAPTNTCDESAFRQIGSPSATFLTGTGAGTFLGGSRTIAGLSTNGPVLDFQVRGWKVDVGGTFFPSYEAARDSGLTTVELGKSVIFRFDTKDPTNILELTQSMSQSPEWTGFAIVPAPFPPDISIHPCSQEVGLGANATFSVVASSAGPLSYQWQFEGTNIIGANEERLTIVEVGSQHRGNYRVIVSNPAGSVTSRAASLEFGQWPELVFGPQSQIVTAGTDLLLEALAIGTPPLRYHWYQDGNELPGRISPTLLITNVQPHHAGTYKVLVTNALGWTSSTGAVVEVWLSLSTRTDGAGFIERSPDQPRYPPNSVVTLTAIPGPGEMFHFWEGDSKQFDNPLNVLMSSNRTIAAQFASTAVELLIAGWGQVIKSPDKPFYDPFERVNLIAVPGRWHAFSHWSDGVTNNPRAITIGVSNFYSLVFTSPPLETLTFNGALRTAPLGMPAIFVDGRFVTEPMVTNVASAFVHIHTSFPNGLILLTLDGTTPDIFSGLYTGLFRVRSSVTLRAIAFSADLSQSWEAEPVRITVLPTYRLSISTPGAGQVAVTPGAGTLEFLSNSVVTLSAVPDPGWTFMGWLGDVSGSEPTVNLTITRDHCVEAIFGTALATTITGKGAVTVTPPVDLLPFGTAVKCYARPEEGSTFVLWNGTVLSTNNPLHFTIATANPALSCVFQPLPEGQFALAVDTEGAGQVTVTPRGSRFRSGQNVTLNAIAAPGQRFLEWSGDAAGSGNSITLSMTQNRVITARFTRDFALGVSACPKCFEFTGELGGIYDIERSSDTSQWVEFATVTNLLGTVQWDWANRATNGSELFRVRLRE